jgi:hypothetical protein
MNHIRVITEFGEYWCYRYDLYENRIMLFSYTESTISNNVIMFPLYFREVIRIEE